MQKIMKMPFGGQNTKILLDLDIKKMNSISIQVPKYTLPNLIHNFFLLSCVIFFIFVALVEFFIFHLVFTNTLGDIEWGVYRHN